MKIQFDNKRTFFDLNIDNNEEDCFATLYCTLGGADKKRAKMNKLAVDYLTQSEQTNQEKEMAKKIIDGTIYEESKKSFEHCKLCSDKFLIQILENISKNYENWEIDCPTHPYTPGGLMLYLKDRKNSHIENLQDLSNNQFDEIIQIMKDLYNKLSEYLDYDVVGINILFNQISKSQLCIHGHLETMIANIDKLQLGCTLKEERNYDVMASLLNTQIEDKDGVYKEKEGLRIDLGVINYQEALKILEKYEIKMKQIITHGRKLQQGKIECVNDIDNMLLKQMSPAPVNYVYLTYYRDKFFLSIVPEIILEPIENLKEINDEIELYSLKINQYAKNDKYKVMRQVSPLIRPSIKLSKDTDSTANINKIKEDITNILEER